MFRNVPPGALTMKGFWSHSLACGITARLLGQRRGEANPEAHFVGGILHDIGTLTIAVNRPMMLADALGGAAARRVPINVVEQAWYGHDHAGVGAVLLEAWNLPPRHRAAVNCHHAPQRAGVFAAEASVVHVADIISTAMQFGSAGDPYVPSVVPAAWDALRLNPNDIGAIMDETDRLFSSVASTFLSEDGA
jgi:HD-like signal output (HDOD) protein